MNEETIIETHNLSKRYDNITVVDQLNFHVQSGEIFGLLGPNGAGKTTTILMLMGLTEPYSGNAKVCGYDPTREPLKVKRLVGYMPEKVGFYDNLTARENLDFIAELNQIDATTANQTIDELLHTVGLDDALDKLVGQFSRGMKQRLGIADALVKEPKVVIFDEPTAGLDPEGINQILDLLRDLPKKGTAVIMCSHRLYEVQRICDRVGILSRGRMLVEDTIEHLGREAFGGGLFRIEVETVKPSAQLIKTLGDTQGIERVELHDNIIIISADSDRRTQISGILVTNGFPIKEIKIQEYTLDDIYMKYFRKEAL